MVIYISHVDCAYIIKPLFLYYLMGRKNELQIIHIAYLS